MNHNTQDKYRALLEAKTRDELNIIARRLSIPSFRKINRDALISAIIQVPDKAKLTKALSISWWDLYHNHVYGVSTLIGLVLTIIFFIVQYTGSNVSAPKVSGQAPAVSSEGDKDKTI